jgi:hypothetical protein
MGGSLSYCNVRCTLEELDIIKAPGEEVGPVELLCSIRGRLAQRLKKFNAGQLEFYPTVNRCLKGEKKASAFYLDGPGGTGKTFVLNSIIDLADSLEIERIVVASSGVAALLLTGGQTAHSAFKIPLDVEQNADCSIVSLLL